MHQATLSALPRRKRTSGELSGRSSPHELQHRKEKQQHSPLQFAPTPPNQKAHSQQPYQPNPHVPLNHASTTPPKTTPSNSLAHTPIGRALAVAASKAQRSNSQSGSGSGSGSNQAPPTPTPLPPPHSIRAYFQPTKKDDTHKQDAGKAANDDSDTDIEHEAGDVVAALQTEAQLSQSHFSQPDSTPPSQCGTTQSMPPPLKEDTNMTEGSQSLPVAPTSNTSSAPPMSPLRASARPPLPTPASPAQSPLSTRRRASALSLSLSTALPIFSSPARPSHRRSASMASPIDPRYMSRLAGQSSIHSPSPRTPQPTSASNRSSTRNTPHASPIPTPRARKAFTFESPSSARSKANVAYPQLHHYPVSPSPYKHIRSHSDLSSVVLQAQHAALFAQPTVPESPASSTSSSSAALSSSVPAPSHLDSLRSLQNAAAAYDYSDRYIPSRAGSNLAHGYFIDNQYGEEYENENDMQENRTQNQAGGGMHTQSPSPFSSAYGVLLRSEILGSKDGSNLPANLQPDEGSTYNSQLLVHRNGVNPSTAPQSDGAAATASHPTAASPSPKRSIAYPQTYRFKSPRRPLSLTNPFLNSPLPVGAETARLLSTLKSPTRHISKAPCKVLDAPNLKDDFYLNLVDWSCQDVVAVALGAQVFLWSAATGKVTQLFNMEDTQDAVTSVSWSMSGNTLAVGMRTGAVQLWDVNKQKQIRSLTSHAARVGCMAWNSQSLATGSRDRQVFLHDPRAQQGENGLMGKLVGHRQEVCGMKWSHDEHQLATGGNDNKLLIWSAQQHQLPVFRFEDHTAAVKAIAWSPHQHGLLCSGGGTADRCIRFWSSVTGQSVSHIDTGSQVCNLMWSRNVNEIVSTHGYSLNQIMVWKYPSMQQVATLTGHTMRVLYLAVSPKGDTILTGAGDETLRFWNVFPSSDSKNSVSSGVSLLSPNRSDIR